MNYSNDNFNEGGTNFEFSDKSIRHGFIRKVYMILFAQLVVTFGFVAIFTLSDDVKLFAARNSYLVWVAFAMTLICLIAISCCGELRRKTPHNFIFLGIFTICEGFLLGCISAAYTGLEILLAVGICFTVVFGLTIFAMQTKYDFTMCGGFVVVSAIVLMIFGFLMIFIRTKILSIVYASVGALLFSFYLVFDTQLMIGGSHKYSISPEEYIFAALNLYIDIVQLFIYILSLIGLARD